MAGPVGGDASAGTLLRKAREKQGIHIAALAASIKVTPRKLEALEGDRYDELPDATFTRALAQAVCRTLKVDPAPVLALLPDASSMVPLDALARGINTPFRERSAHSGVNDSPLWVRPAFWLPLLVIAAAAVIYWFPASGWRTGESTPAAAPASGALAASTPAGVVQETVVMPPPAASAAASGSSAAPPIVTPVVAVTVTDTPTPPPSTLRLRTTEPSWVEVQDSGGRTLISRVIDSGEAVDLDGSLPLKLRIGNAPATQIVFRGQPVDIGRYTRENIARFELK